jgi:hypothetical protein
MAGPDWIEGRGIPGVDAGSTIEFAEKVVGVGELETISGSLEAFGGVSGGGISLPDYEDMYVIRIFTPGVFNFRVSSANFDAQLWLFNVTLPGEAFGLLANNDRIVDDALVTDPRLTSPANDGTGATVTLPGVYAIAISGLGRVPVSAGGNIFSFASATEISGPDGPGGTLPHIDWTGVGQTGDYVIEVTDVGFFDVPAPGSLGTLVIAGVFAARRRRDAVC